MNYLLILLKLLSFVPTIAATVEAHHAGATVETKLQKATDYLNLATNVAAAVLPPEQSQLATTAGAAAQSVLATTVQAIHDANNPTPAPVVG